MIDIAYPALGGENRKCSFCDNNALTLRKHSGQLLCKDCFIKSVEKIVASTISKYNMLKPRDQIVVGLSGGKDSTMLLYNLIKIQKKIYNSKSLIALTIDEGIEGYSEKIIEISKKFCKKYKINQEILSFKEKFGLTLDEIVKKKASSNDYKDACNYCATIRRRILNDVAKELGANILALGHNLSDICETFLTNILYKRIKLKGTNFYTKKRTRKLGNIIL